MLQDIEELGLVVEEIHLLVVLLEEHLPCFVVLVDHGVDAFQLVVEHLDQFLVDTHAGVQGCVDALDEVQALAPEQLYQLLLYLVIVNGHLLYHQNRHLLDGLGYLQQEVMHPSQQFLVVLPTLFQEHTVFREPFRVEFEVGILYALWVLQEDGEFGALLVVGRDVEEVLFVADVGQEVQKRLDFGLLESLLFTGNIRYHHLMDIAEQVEGVLGLQHYPLEDELVGLLELLHQLVLVVHTAPLLLIQSLHFFLKTHLFFLQILVADLAVHVPLVGLLLVVDQAGIHQGFTINPNTL